MHEKWPPILGEAFPPGLKKRLIDDSSKRVIRAKQALIIFTFLACLVIGVTVVYGSILSSAPTNKTVTYITKQGDTLWQIAQHFDPNGNTQDVISEIEHLNRLDDNSFLQVDKQLIVPVGR